MRVLMIGALHYGYRVYGPYEDNVFKEDLNAIEEEFMTEQDHREGTCTWLQLISPEEANQENRDQIWYDTVQEKWDAAAEAAGINPELMDHINFDSAKEGGLSPDDAIKWAIGTCKGKSRPSNVN